jgi:hypothetical protein
MVRAVPEGWNYRAKFVGRPDLDSASFTDYTGRIAKGLEVTRDGETWRLSDVVEEAGDDHETLVFERVDKPPD